MDLYRPDYKSLPEFVDELGKRVDKLEKGGGPQELTADKLRDKATGNNYGLDTNTRYQVGEPVITEFVKIDDDTKEITKISGVKVDTAVHSEQVEGFGDSTTYVNPKKNVAKLEANDKIAMVRQIEGNAYEIIALGQDKYNKANADTFTILEDATSIINLQTLYEEFYNARKGADRIFSIEFGKGYIASGKPSHENFIEALGYPDESWKGDAFKGVMLIEMPSSEAGDFQLRITARDIEGKAIYTNLVTGHEKNHVKAHGWKAYKEAGGIKFISSIKIHEQIIESTDNYYNSFSISKPNEANFVVIKVEGNSVVSGYIIGDFPKFSYFNLAYSRPYRDFLRVQYQLSNNSIEVWANTSKTSIVLSPTTFDFYKIN